MLCCVTPGAQRLALLERIFPRLPPRDVLLMMNVERNTVTGPPAAI